jgi:hypothetical protein
MIKLNARLAGIAVVAKLKALQTLEELLSI